MNTKPHIYMRNGAWWIWRPAHPNRRRASGGPTLGPYYYWPMVLSVAGLMHRGLR